MDFFFKKKKGKKFNNVAIKEMFNIIHKIVNFIDDNLTNNIYVSMSGVIRQ
jgi:hypothetical protein